MRCCFYVKVVSINLNTLGNLYNLIIDKSNINKETKIILIKNHNKINSKKKPRFIVLFEF